MYVGVASLEADDTRLKVEKEENYAIPRAGNWVNLIYCFN